MRNKTICTVQIVLDTDDPAVAADMMSGLLSENGEAHGIIDWSYVKDEVNGDEFGYLSPAPIEISDVEDYEEGEAFVQTP